MRHHVSNRKFGRVRKGRTALLRSLARSLVLYGRIETTEAKAKGLRPYIEKIITRGKTDSLAARRIIASRLGGDDHRRITDKIVTTIAPKFKDRAGGYTRITKLSVDHAGRPKAVIEFVE